MKKRLTSILLIICMALTMLTMTAIADTGTAAPAHGRLADGGYNIYCLSGRYVTVDTYPSIRSVQLAFPDAALVVFYVENKGNNQITLKVNDPNSSTYLYVGIDSSIKNGVALKLVESPYLWNTYTENDTKLIFSLRPSTNTKMFANASGESKAPRTQIILWTNSGKNAPQHGEFRFEPVADSVKTPVATDYSFGNLTQTQGSVTPVRIEGSTVSSPGAVTVLYNGSTTLPKAAGSYRVTFNVAAAPPAWNAASGLAGGTLVIAPKLSTAAPVGKIISMGGINWRVLDVQDGKALVLSDLILDYRPYQEESSLKNAWTDSSLYTYLNGDFYNKTFTKGEKNRIVSTTAIGKVFLLSAEEADRYLVNGDARIAYADRRTPALKYSPILDIYDERVYQYYTPCSWWLRTPSKYVSYEALAVSPYSNELREWRINEGNGVRPAMWINVAGGSFSPYQPLKFNAQPAFFTMEDMVKAIAIDIVKGSFYAGDLDGFLYGTVKGPYVAAIYEVRNGAIPPGYKYEVYVSRMRMWGVLPLRDNFDPFAEVTYGQFKDYLMKMLDWSLKYDGPYPGSEIYKAFTSTRDSFLTIAEKRAGISDTSANAKPVKAEMQRLVREITNWLAAVNDSGVRLLEGPTKTKYKVGEGFDITGLLVVAGPYGKETNLNNKLTFTTSGVTLTLGRPFQTAGKKVVEIRYEGEKVAQYTVNVSK